MRDQLVWMDRFYNARRNIKHAVVDPGSDIIRLARDLQKGIEFHSNRRTGHKTTDLITMGSDTLESSVKKFNKKMSPSTSIPSHKEPTVDENKNETNAIDVDIAKAIGEAHDKWFEADALDAMFAARISQDNER